MPCNCTIPDGLPTILQQFVITLMSECQGDIVDIYEFGYRYFQDRLENRKRSIIKETNLRRGYVQIPSMRASGPIHSISEESVLSLNPNLSISQYHSKSSLKSCYGIDAECIAICNRPVFQEKSINLRESISNDIKDIPLFRFLDENQKRHIIDAISIRSVDAGDTVIEEGEYGDRFYVIRSGIYEAYSKRCSTDKPLRVYEEVGSFGELALMYDMPRAASIVARTSGNLWSLDRVTFRREVVQTAIEKRLRYEPILRGIKFMLNFSRYERSKIADALAAVNYIDKEVIIRQYQPADCMFFVESGEVKVCVKKNNSREVEISKKHRGDYFGELGLLSNDKIRTATVYSVGSSRCLRLDRIWFERLMNNGLEIMRKNAAEYELQICRLFGGVGGT